MVLKERPKFLQVLSCFLVLNIFPFFLVMSDDNLLKFTPLYLSVYIPFIVIATLIFIKEKFPLQSFWTKAAVFIPFIMPFFITAAYPFTMTSLFLLAALIIFCLLLPLWNVPLTKWFYTLGGLTPLPTDVSQILDGKPTRFGTKKYQQYIQKASIIYPILFIVASIIFRRTEYVPLMIFFLQAGSFIAIFGISLAIGVTLKKSCIRDPSTLG